MSGQLTLSLLLVAASVVYLVLRVVRMLRGRGACHGDAANGAAERGERTPESRPRPLRRL